MDKNKFLLPQTMLNETKMYNEFLVERKIKKDGKLVNRKPSYAVFMAKSIEDINDKDERWQQAKKMAAQLDIPIVVVDVTKCAELELQKVQDMLNLVKEQNRMDLIPEILQKIENNRIFTLGELKKIRKEVFSEKIVKETLEDIINKVFGYRKF